MLIFWLWSVVAVAVAVNTSVALVTNLRQRATITKAVRDGVLETIALPPIARLDADRMLWLYLFCAPLPLYAAG